MHANNAMPPASRRTNNNNLKPPFPAPPSSPPLARSLGALAFLFHTCDILDWVLGRNGKMGFISIKPPLLESSSLPRQDTFVHCTFNSTEYSDLFCFGSG